MSTGHSSTFDDDVTDSTTRRLRHLLAEYPDLDEFPDQDRSVSHRFDIPWLAGRNKKGDRVYITRKLVLLRPIKRLDSKAAQSVWITPYLVRHELIEWWMMEHLSLQYEESHHLATADEKLHIEADGFDWSSYRDCLRPDIKKDEHHSPLSTPPDLDLRPYQESGSKPLLQKILNAQHRGLRSASQLFGRKGARKSSKRSVHYQTDPKGSQQCDRCTMFIPPSHCTAVEGTILPFAWCELFERKEGKASK